MKPLAAAGFLARADGLRDAEGTGSGRPGRASAVAFGPSEGRDLEQDFAGLLHQALVEAPDAHPPAMDRLPAGGRQGAPDPGDGTSPGASEVVGEMRREPAASGRAGTLSTDAPDRWAPAPFADPGSTSGRIPSVQPFVADGHSEVGGDPTAPLEPPPVAHPERSDAEGMGVRSSAPVRMVRRGDGPLAAAPAPDTSPVDATRVDGGAGDERRVEHGNPRRPVPGGPVADRTTTRGLQTSTFPTRAVSAPDPSATQRLPHDGSPLPGTESSPPVRATAPSTFLPSADDDPVEMDPRLRAAVSRVIRRLQVEHGIDARVVEGYRTPERQRALYAQGRTRPGDVVTWTLDSAHTRGRAVDMILNGQWSDLEPYSVLQQVAREEGLATLGMQDPGHLELPASVRSTLPETLGSESRRWTSALARAASVAGVAGRAHVARPAAPAVPGVRPPAAPPSPPDTRADAAPIELPLPTPPSTVPEPDAEDLRLPDGTRFETIADGTGRPRPEIRSGEGATPRTASSPADSSAAATSSGERPAPLRVSREPGTPGSIDGADRVERVRAIQEAAGRTPPRMHVDLGDVDGHGTRVRVDLRGTQVGTRIDVTDPSLGTTLDRELGTLRSSLEGRGLESDGIRVRLITEELSPLRSVPRGPEVQAGSEAQARDFRDRPRHESSDSGQPREQPRHDDLRHRRREEHRRDDR